MRKFNHYLWFAFILQTPSFVLAVPLFEPIHKEITDLEIYMTIFLIFFLFILILFLISATRSTSPLNLNDCRKLYLRQFQVLAKIDGGAPERLWVDVDLYVDNTINYDFARKFITDFFTTTNVRCRNSVCEDLAKILLVQNGVSAVRVSTWTPDIYHDCACAGVAVFLSKSNSTS